MKVLSLIMSMLLLASASVSASDNVPAEYKAPLKWHVVNVNEWNSILVQGSYKVEVKVMPDSAGTLRVLANDAMLRDLKTKNEGSNLTITTTDKKEPRRLAPLIIAYSNGDLSEVTLQGSGDILLPPLKSGRLLTLKLQGSGDIKLSNARMSHVEAILQGSGDIDLINLKVNMLDLTLQGSGDIDVKKLSAANLNCTLQGSGDIDLTGDAAKVNMVLQGSGDIDAANLKIKDLNAQAKGTGGITFGEAKKIVIKGENIRQSKKIKH